MTDTVQVESPDTLVRAFRSHLNPALQPHAHPTAAITRAVWEAVTHRGWTPRELARECETALDNTRPGAVITHRLRQAADGTRPRPTAHPGLPTFTQPRPKCSACDPNRFVETERDGRTVLVRCSCWTPPPRGGITR